MSLFKNEVLSKLEESIECINDNADYGHTVVRIEDCVPSFSQYYVTAGDFCFFSANPVEKYTYHIIAYDIAAGWAELDDDLEIRFDNEFTRQEPIGKHTQYALTFCMYDDAKEKDGQIYTEYFTSRDEAENYYLEEVVNYFSVAWYHIDLIPNYDTLIEEEKEN